MLVHVSRKEKWNYEIPCEMSGAQSFGVCEIIYFKKFIPCWSGLNICSWLFLGGISYLSLPWFRFFSRHSEGKCVYKVMEEILQKDFWKFSPLWMHFFFLSDMYRIVIRYVHHVHKSMLVSTCYVLLLITLPLFQELWKSWKRYCCWHLQCCARCCDLHPDVPLLELTCELFKRVYSDRSEVKNWRHAQGILMMKTRICHLPPGNRKYPT